MLSYSRSGLHPMSYWPTAAATTDGRSLAVLFLSAGTGMRLESYGDPRAADILTTLLDDWRAAGRPGSADLVVEVTFDAAWQSVVTPAWRRPDHHSSTVSSRR